MSHSHLSFAFGILGNIASFVCFLAPLPTFYRVCKKKSTEGFQSIPYVAALFSAMLWIFYAYVKTGETLLITINAFGCVIETIYLAVFITYCPKKARMSTLRMIVLLNFGGFCTIVLLTHLLAKGEEARVKLLGWICVVFATSVFAAPLSIIRVVIRTKSVEFLPFPLSLLLLISAIMWLLYGISLKDIYVTLPNVVGLTFGVIQIGLYAMYRNNKPIKDQKLPEHKGDIVESENVIAPTVNGEKQEQEVKPQGGDIEIGEKKEENNKQDQQQSVENKKLDQVAHDQTELNNNNINKNNNKTEERVSCEV
ncbi:bidirectional sugar transporter SWEET12-like [Glycine soja]|uniref:Bidirectional sugar transporter SWEET n=1 Tax=Glycine soja TaxID=3848 RepID=A0A0B2QQU2_GLYSO|nr:bidirectional sugar transporter SWEET12-like [Glycine soja]KHN23961.1 Bidirectional sugar transporter SWEET12 [Glycine soja]RZC07903.1 Bidirectional sugar transporter SWEET12 [Glycine soja]